MADPLRDQALGISPELRARIDAIKAQRSSQHGQQHQDREKTRLSARELEVLQLFADGKARNDIAALLFISPETVKTHIRHVREFLDARTIGHAIALAYERGIFTPESAPLPRR